MQRAYLWGEQQLRAAAWCQGITMVRGPGREIARSWELPKLSSLLSIICGGKAKVRENLQKQSCGLSDTGPAQAPEGRGISSKKKKHIQGKPVLEPGVSSFRAVQQAP